MRKYIPIIQGDDTGTISTLLTIILNTGQYVNISGFSGTLRIGHILKEFDVNEIASRVLKIDLTNTETKQLTPGNLWGEFKLYSSDNKILTVVSNIPFFVHSGQFENPYDITDFTLNMNIELGGENILHIDFVVGRMEGGGQSGLTKKLVIALPEVGEENILYYVPQDEQTPEGYPIVLQFIWDNEQYYIVGAQSTEIDLTPYERLLKLSKVWLTTNVVGQAAGRYYNVEIPDYVPQEGDLLLLKPHAQSNNLQVEIFINGISYGVPQRLQTNYDTTTRAQALTAFFKVNRVYPLRFMNGAFYWDNLKPIFNDIIGTTNGNVIRGTGVATDLAGLANPTVDSTLEFIIGTGLFWKPKNP